MAIPRPEVTLDTGDTIIKVRQYDETGGGMTAFVVQEINKTTGLPMSIQCGRHKHTLIAVHAGDFTQLSTGRLMGADGKYTYGY